MSGEVGWPFRETCFAIFSFKTDHLRQKSLHRKYWQSRIDITGRGR